MHHPLFFLKQIGRVWLGLLAGLSLGEAQPRATSHPNIIVIFADDLGYGDLASFGGTTPTPHLDRLAREGMKLTHFYAQPLCSPSRASLLTGCYSQRVGFPYVVGPQGPSWTADKYNVGLNPAEQTLPELLKAQGYATACVGKWHLGHLPEHLPTRHGFDQYFGLPYSNDMVKSHGSEWGDLPLIDGETTLEQNPDQSELTRRYTERAVSFIRQNRHARPFFLYLAHSMPHVPIFASKRFKGKSGQGLYADVIQELDWSVGEVLKALKANQLDKNTLVVFTSDNGPWLRQGNHAGSAGGLREGKNTTFEGGVRVPALVWWPGHVPASSTNAQPAHLIDLLPTFTQLTGAPKPTAAIDGRSILPRLLGQTNEPDGREVTYFFLGTELQALRKGRWKLHLPHRYEHVVKPNHDGSMDAKSESLPIDLSLFDLETDPGERQNVALQHPALVQELRQLATRFADELQRTRRPAAVAEAR
jgi:arylsulfatase A